MKIKTLDFITPTNKYIVKVDEKHLWNKFFKDHHYMDGTLPNGCIFYTLYILKDDKEILVSCLGVLFQITRKTKARRITRLVVLPEFQGLSISSTFLNTICEYYISEGIQEIFINTFHPRLGNFLSKSSLWNPSQNNLEAFETTKHEDELIISWGMSGLRDGVPMYRYKYINTFGASRPVYKLLYNPIKLITLRRQIREFKTRNEIDIVNNVIEVVNKLKIIEKDYKREIFILEKGYQYDSIEFLHSLSTDDKKHKESKKEHKKMFKGNKAKRLTKEQKEFLKKQKEDKNQLQEFF